MHRSAFIFIAALLAASYAGAQTKQLVAHPADIVDPRIGVLGNGEGNTVIGPTLPQGSIHPSPDTPQGGQSGYRIDRPIRGFSQLHASGTGWGTYGNLLVSPQIGLGVAPDSHDSPKSDEQARAYDYRVRLDRYNVLAELTPTRHAAIYRFTFPNTKDAYLTLDLGAQIPGQLGTGRGDGSKVDDSTVTINPHDGSFSGSSHYVGGWANKGYTLYFYGQLDHPPTNSGTWINSDIHKDSMEEHYAKDGDRVGSWWNFTTTNNQPVLMKIAVSFRSIAKAQAYLRAEIPGWDYVGVRDAARQAWDEALGRMQISGVDATQQTLFYTALYHSKIMPRDRTGEYVRFPEQAPMWDDFYATWDIWRTDYPLMLLLQPDVVRGTIASFVERQKVDGVVRDSVTAGTKGYGPELGTRPYTGGWSNNLDQGGNDIDNIIADAYVKGLKGVDWNAAYAVLKFDADHGRQGNFPEGAEDYRRQGWIRPGEMSVSNTLEYAYNDFCASEVAAGLGKKEDAQRYRERSRQWQYLFDPASESDHYKGFILPRKEDGSWIDYDPKRFPGSWHDYFYEGNSWTYTYFVPHQIGKLVNLLGGPALFTERLDHANATDLIEYFNEPGFLAPTLFHYAGRPDESAHWVKSFSERYTLHGVPGDDDSGAMSASYVWLSTGLFPNAGQDIYFLNPPLVPYMTIDRPEDGLLTIMRKGEGSFISSVTINGRPLDRAWVHHRELSGKTTLVFTMSQVPGTWGTKNPPPSDMGTFVPGRTFDMGQ